MLIKLLFLLEVAIVLSEIDQAFSKFFHIGVYIFDLFFLRGHRLIDLCHLINFIATLVQIFEVAIVLIRKV